MLKRMQDDDFFEVKDVFKLTQYGVPSSQVTWPRVNLSNGGLLCALHTDGRSSSEESMYSSTSKGPHVNKVQIINCNGKVVSRSKTIADSAKVHPAKPIIALKAHSHFQVYNFETKNLLSELEVHTEVVFWKWVNNEMMMIVTETNVLQWSVFRDKSEAEDICTRLPRLNYSEIVNCAVDDNHRWYSITGLVDHGKGSLVEGVTQIYSADYGVAQCIEAHATTFSTYKFDGNLYESTVLCLASRPLDLPNGKVHTVELGPVLIGNATLRFSSSDLQFSSAAVQGDSAQHSCHTDFPVNIQADRSHCVLYITTKYGRLYVAEFESAIVLSSVQVSHDITFCSSLDPLSTVSIISRSGQVFTVTVNWLVLIKYIRIQLGRAELANRLQNSRGMENVDLLDIS